MSLFKNTRGREEMREPDVKPRRGIASRPPLPPVQREREEGAEMANIGKSISIKGDVIGDEDTVIEGRVEGRIELKNHHLTIGPNGDVRGEISAKQVTIVGRVSGNVVATERTELRDSGRIEGDLLTPRLLVQEGGQLNGKITMKPVAGAGTVSKPSLETPAVQIKAG